MDITGPRAMRALARHGYIERAAGATGRDRPWQITDVTQNWSRAPQEPDTEAATTLLGEVVQEWEFGRIRDGRHLPVPAGWPGR